MSVGNLSGYNSFPIPTGAILPFAGVAPSTVPMGFHLCDGSLYSASVFSELFRVVGTVYNVGGEPAGQFRIPNLTTTSQYIEGSSIAGAGVVNPADVVISGGGSFQLTTANLPNLSSANFDNQLGSWNVSANTNAYPLFESGNATNSVASGANSDNLIKSDSSDSTQASLVLTNADAIFTGVGDATVTPTFTTTSVNPPAFQLAYIIKLWSVDPLPMYAPGTTQVNPFGILDSNVTLSGFLFQPV